MSIAFGYWLRRYEIGPLRRMNQGYTLARRIPCDMPKWKCTLVFDMICHTGKRLYTKSSADDPRDILCNHPGNSSEAECPQYPHQMLWSTYSKKKVGSGCIFWSKSIHCKRCINRHISALENKQAGWSKQVWSKRKWRNRFRPFKSPHIKQT